MLALMDELGFLLVPEGRRELNSPVQAMILVADGPLLADRQMVTSVLAQPGGDSFDFDLQAAVSRWTENFWLGKADLHEGDLSLLFSP